MPVRMPFGQQQQRQTIESTPSCTSKHNDTTTATTAGAIYSHKDGGDGVGECELMVSDSNNAAGTAATVLLTNNDQQENQATPRSKNAKRRGRRAGRACCFCWCCCCSCSWANVHSHRRALVHRENRAKPAIQKSLLLHSKTHAPPNSIGMTLKHTPVVVLSPAPLVVSTKSIITDQPAPTQMLFTWLPCFPASAPTNVTNNAVVNNHQQSSLTVPNVAEAQPERDGNQNQEIDASDTVEEKPSYDDAIMWGTSFDAMMAHKAGQKLFAEFLKSEFSDENILFWQACEELKRESNPEKIEEKARIIYEDFISILSPKEVSLDSRVREIINTNMVHPSSHTFDGAQHQIYTLMQRDSYPRFVSCSMYKRLLQSYGQFEDL